MRLFVAIDPPAEPLAQLEAAVAPLRPAWPDLRWASRDRWHVTLAFLGEVDPARLDRLARAVERAARRHPAMTLVIGHAGAFPSPHRAQVLWVRVEGDERAQAGLRALAASVAAGARRAGVPPPDEGRRFRPHVTLARSRRPADLGPLVAELSGLRTSACVPGPRRVGRSQPGPDRRHDARGTLRGHVPSASDLGSGPAWLRIRR